MVNFSGLTDEELDAAIKKERSISTLSDAQLDAEIAIERERTRPIPEVPEGGFSSFPGLIDKLKSFGTEVLAEFPTIATATGGALIGGSVGGVPGAIAGGLGGGVVGALSKETVEQGLIRLGIIEEGDKLISDIPIKKKALDESLLDAGAQGVATGIGEGAGQALIAPFTKVGRGFSRSVTPEGREAIELFKGTGIVPNPAKVTDSRILDLASNAGEASIFGGEKFLQGQIQAVDFIDGLINKLVGSMSRTKESLGTLFSDAITESSIAFRAAGKTLFDRIDQTVGTGFVNTAGIRRLADDIIDELSGLNVEPSLIKSLREAGETTLGPDALQRTGLRFSEAQGLRSDLLAVTRKSGNVISDKSTGRINRLLKILEREMEITAKSAGPKVLQQWRRANKFWKDGLDTFNAKVIRDIMNKDPDAAVATLFTAIKDRAVMIRRVKRALKDKKLVRDFENATFKTILFRSRDELGDIVPAKLLNQIKAFGGEDGQALKAMFPRGEDKVLAKLARIKGVILKGQPDATGRFAVQIGQITAGVALISGQFKRAALAILIVPDLLARAFRHPGIVRFITEGAKPRPGIKAAVTFTTRLSTLLADAGINHQVIEGGIDISPTKENAEILRQQQQPADVTPKESLRALKEAIR